MISFVYFDVGGVLVDDVNGRIDKWIKMKRDIGITEKNDEEFDRFYDKREEEICEGKDVDEIIPLIEERFNIKFPGGYSLFSDFIDRFEKNQYIQLVIDEIKQECRIGLLTNMYPGMLSVMIKKGIMPETNYDVVIDSSIEKCQKPELKIFQIAEEKANTKKGEILFVDNKVENIDAAKNFGWRTFLYDPSNHKKSCTDLLNYFNKMKQPSS